jgi:excisionase family DNA binding protein
MDVLSVARAADVLDVSPRRVRQLLESGRLAGEQLGRSWVIDRGDVDRLRRRGVGRPWSASSAWAVLGLAAGRNPELSSVERSRARTRLADRGLAGLMVQLRERAERREAYAHPSVLARVAGDDRVVRGGVSAAHEYRVHLIVRDAAEVYVRASDVADLADSYALEVDADRPNVILHVVDDVAWPFDDDEQFASWAVVGVDLLDADDERSCRAGLELVERQQ